MHDFKKLKVAVAAQFARMTKATLLRSSVDKKALWDTYLASFPEGSNPIHVNRTEHDCNCCKQFIRAVGGSVAVIDGKLVSVWDVVVDDSAYQAVANALAALVKSAPIADAFLHVEPRAGTDRNFQDLLGGGQVGWDHFFVNVPTSYVMKKKDIPTALAKLRSSHDVLARGLTEITDDAIETTLELIAQNTLYRGAEHKFIVDEFRKTKRSFERTPPELRDAFVWEQAKTLHESVSGARNTVIGTLLTDLSEGKELDQAVGSYEQKVAPNNYKRPTALVTKGMIEKARAEIEKLGLTSALERRYATLDDITINNILYANRDTRQSMVKGDVFAELESKAKAPTKSFDKVDEVPIEKFLADILPRAETIELMLENAHEANMVSLIAPQDPTAQGLFKWGNQFSWSYAGELADSIKERVKKAGGNVTGDLCCRLSWSNFDDLDFHMIEPDGYEIYFGNRARSSPNGGTLDVDMNAGCGTTRVPVENIVYASKAKMKEGQYTLNVHNFSKRESVDVGFEVELDFMGAIHRFAHTNAVPDKRTVNVVKFNYSKKEGISIISSLPSTQTVRTFWGLPSQTFHKVTVLMMSPNYWDGQQGIGNKHYFFMLEGCAHDGQARGFFNEFLRAELNPHRKVIELVGSKMKTAESARQLSGLGFSSTQRNAVLCRVKGAFSRVIKIIF